MPSTEYFVCRCRLHEKVGYFLWSRSASVEHLDEVVVTDDIILLFPTELAIREYATKTGVAVEADAPMEYDLDRLAAWCQHPAIATLDCEAALNAWNLFSDLPRAKRTDLFAHADTSAKDVYQKLFWANNLPTVTPEGEQYTPLWSDAELTALRRALEFGLTAFATLASDSNGG